MPFPRLQATLSGSIGLQHAGGNLLMDIDFWWPQIVPRSNRFLVRIGLNISCLKNGMLLKAVLHGCTFVSFVYLVLCICRASIRPSVRWFATRHGTGSLGHRGNGSFGSSFTSGSPGNRVIILTRCETVVFPVFEKMAKMQNLHLKCWNDKSHCQVSVVGLKSLDVSPCNELLLLPMIIKNSLAWEYFFIHKSTFGVHYSTGSPGQLGPRVAGFPGHWVAGSQNVTQFHLCLLL